MRRLLDFKNMVRCGVKHNFSVTLYNIDAANTIFCPDIPSLKGKMVRRQINLFVSNYVRIPPDIVQLQQIATVVIDVVFEIGMGLLV